MSGVYEKLINLKSTKLILDDGRGRKLYEVIISPAFRIKHFQNNRPPYVLGFELKNKADVTKNVYDNGWILIDNRQQIENRQSNPRPRKYANAAERQAAYRERNVLIEIRLDAKTADTLTRLAQSYDLPRAEFATQVLKHGLLNRNWVTMGPRYDLGSDTARGGMRQVPKLRTKTQDDKL